MITPEDKRLLQKEVALIIKEFRGVGPQSHSLNDLGGELYILISGTLTPIEKNLFRLFGQEYFEAVYKFYYQMVAVSVTRLDELLHNKYHFVLIAWEQDFYKDRITYRIKYSQELV